LCVLANAAQAVVSLPSYTITDLGTLGGTESKAYAINQDGLVTGSSKIDEDAESHAFLYDPLATKKMKDLGVLDEGKNSCGYAINNLGTVVGQSDTTASGDALAFIYKKTDTVMQKLGDNLICATGINDTTQTVGWMPYSGTTGGGGLVYTPFLRNADGSLVPLGVGEGKAYGINNDATVVGMAQANSKMQAFVHPQGGPAILLGTLGGSNSCAYAINGEGRVVGDSQIAGDGASHAFYADPNRISSTPAYKGLVELLPLEGYVNSHAYAINGSNIIVGTSDTLEPTDEECTVAIDQRACLWESDGIVAWDLNEFVVDGDDWTLQEARGINDAGQIVGWGLIKGEIHAFLLTPAPVVPEPSTLALLGLGIVAIAGYVRSRKK
jgi:probable HAF family extracellular repeat protein